jgi:hypothetical protein
MRIVRLITVISLLVAAAMFIFVRVSFLLPDFMVANFPKLASIASHLSQISFWGGIGLFYGILFIVAMFFLGSSKIFAKSSE